MPPAPSATNSSSSKPPASAGSRSARAASNSNNDSWDDWGKPSNVKVARPIIIYICNILCCLADVPSQYWYQGMSASQYSHCTQLETIVSVIGKFCIWSAAHAACLLWFRLFANPPCLFCTTFLNSHNAHPLSGLRTCIYIIAAVLNLMHSAFGTFAVCMQSQSNSYKAGTVLECSLGLQAIRFALYKPAI